MPEVEGPMRDSAVTGDAQPLSETEVEHLRRGGSTLPQPGESHDDGRTLDEQRQAFITQASAALRHEAAHAEVAGRTLQGQPHKDGDMIDINAQDELDKAARLREQAAQAEQDAAAAFDGEHSA